MFNKYIFDLRSRSQILYIENLSKKTVNYVSPQEHLKKNFSNSFFPLSGVSNVNTVLCIENGYWVKYTSDEYGFNSKQNKELKNNRKKILLIGDSFAHGQCVKDNETISGKLLSNNFNVVNRSYSGTGPLIQYATLKEYIDQAKPDYVIWVYFENDLQDLSKEIKHPLLSRYLDENFLQNLIKKQKKINLLLSKNYNFKKKEVKKYNFSDLIKLHYLRFYLLNSFDYNFFKLKHRGKNDLKLIKQNYSDDLLNQFFNIINKAKKLSEMHGAEFHFIYIPVYLRYKFNHDDKFLNYDNLISFLEENQINFTDLVSEFKKKKDPILFYSLKRGHFTPEGYSLLVEKFLKEID